MRVDSKSLIIFALAALLIWLVVDRPVHAGTDGGGGDADRGLIAVTGTYGSGASALYLVDTRTRHLAVYRLENGRALEFIAARDCTYDFFLESFNDESPASMSPPSLRRSWQEFNRRGGQNAAAPDATKPGEGGKTPAVPGAAGEKSEVQKVVPEVAPPTQGGKGGAAPEGEHRNG
jgi:hypothetical protein